VRCENRPHCGKKPTALRRKIDRTAVGIDRTAVGIDRTAQGIDRTAIGIDRTAVRTTKATALLSTMNFPPRRG